MKAQVTLVSVISLSVLFYLTSTTEASGPITQQNSFIISESPVKMAYSSIYDLLFTMTSQTIYVYDGSNGTLVGQQSATYQFTDISITPDGRYLFAADFGGQRTGYGDPVNPHYVHRYDLSENRWEIGNAPKIAYRLEAVSDEQVLLLEQDQWVDLTLNKFAPIMTELHRVSSDYYGDIEYDPISKRIYHGNSGSSSREIHAFVLEGATIKAAGSTGTYGSANSGGGTSVLSSDGKTFYYGSLQVEALDITNNLNKFSESIYAASAAIAFGSSQYYDSKTAAILGNFGFSSSKYALDRGGQHIWAYNSSSKTVYHYTIDNGQPQRTLQSLEISGPGVVAENLTVTYNTIAVYSDGFRKEVTDQSSWSLSSNLYGSIDSTGSFTAFTIASEGVFDIKASFEEDGVLANAVKTVAYKPSLSDHQLTEVESFSVGGQAYQIEYSKRFNLLFLRNSGSAVRLIDTTNQTELELHYATETFTDMDLTPDERFLFVADYGGEQTGYGTPVRTHYVHRYDVMQRTWETLAAPKIAWKIEAVSSSRVLLQEHDQHIDITLNSFEDGQMRELSRIRGDYYGDFEFDHRTNRVYHGCSGSSSSEIHVRKVVDNNTLVNAGDTGTYGTAQSGGGTSVLSSDGHYFYYGRLQVEAMDITNNLHYYPELIYAGSKAIAFGSSYYYDAYKGDPLGTLGFACSVYFISDDGKHLWAFEDSGDIVHHYLIGNPTQTSYLESLQISGPSSVSRKKQVPFTATAFYNDGSSEDVTVYVDWSLESTAYGTINDEGVLQTYGYNQPTNIVVQASYAENGIQVTANKTIGYIPEPVTYYIDAENGDDDNDGVSPESAFATIMRGVREAYDGDTIKLNPGAYQETIYFLGKAIRITSAADPAVINGQSSQVPDAAPRNSGELEQTPIPPGAIGGVVFENHENMNSILENIVIRNCFAGIYCGNASPTIKNVTVVNNAFGIIAWDNANPKISNAILWFNSVQDLQGAAVSYSCVQIPSPGEGNISVYPEFVDPLNHDYHLKSRMGHYSPASNSWVLDDLNSPCIDMGNPLDDPLIEPEPNGGFVNMGADGHTPFASKSPVGWPNSADLNHDGIVNFEDLSILGQNWLWEAPWR